MKQQPEDGSPCPALDDRGMREVHCEYGDRYGVSIRVRMPRDFDKEADFSWSFHAAELIKRGMLEGTAKLDPQTAIEIAKLEACVRAMFTNGGFDVVYIERIPNGYWPEAYADIRIRQPWFIVTTTIGHFEVGWRKRVIHIGWERTRLGKDFDLMSRGEDTHGRGYCHAYDYNDGAKVLSELAAHVGDL